MSLLVSLIGAIAHMIHPDKPREFFEGVRFPTDLSADEVATRLDAAAAANPAFKDWRDSIVDLMKLTHPDDPDEASSMPKRRALAAELGRSTYEGSDEDNRWLHGEVFKAIQQRGIPMPAAD